MTIVALYLKSPAYWYPGWHPGLGITRDQWAFTSGGGYTITREGDVYLVESVRIESTADGGQDRVVERTEVPASNVKNAVLLAERTVLELPAAKSMQLKPLARVEPKDPKGGRR